MDGKMLVAPSPHIQRPTRINEVDYAIIWYRLEKEKKSLKQIRISLLFVLVT